MTSSTTRPQLSEIRSVTGQHQRLFRHLNAEFLPQWKLSARIVEVLRCCSPLRAFMFEPRATYRTLQLHLKQRNQNCVWFLMPELRFTSCQKFLQICTDLWLLLLLILLRPSRVSFPNKLDQLWSLRWPGWFFTSHSDHVEAQFCVKLLMFDRLPEFLFDADWSWQHHVKSLLSCLEGISGPPGLPLRHVHS